MTTETNIFVIKAVEKGIIAEANFSVIDIQRALQLCAIFDYAKKGLIPLIEKVMNCDKEEANKIIEDYKNTYGDKFPRFSILNEGEDDDRQKRD